MSQDPTANFGYPSTAPCCVCGKHNRNQSEPRFNYVVCVEHQKVPPAHLEDARVNWLKNNS